MPSKIKFTSVEIINVSRTASAGTVDVKCPMTQAVIKKMEWVQKKEEGGKEVTVSTEIPSFVRGSAALDGELASTSMTFTPKDDTLARKYQMDLVATKVNNFKAVRLQAEGTNAKDAFRHELRFQIHFSDEEGASKIERFMQSVPKCSIDVSYEKPAVQEEIFGTEASADEAQQAFEEI